MPPLIVLVSLLAVVCRDCDVAVVEESKLLLYTLLLKLTPTGKFHGKVLIFTAVFGFKPVEIDLVYRS